MALDSLTPSLDGNQPPTPEESDRKDEAVPQNMLTDATAYEAFGLLDALKIDSNGGKQGAAACTKTQEPEESQSKPTTQGKKTPSSSTPATSSMDLKRARIVLTFDTGALWNALVNTYLPRSTPSNLGHGRIYKAMCFSDMTIGEPEEMGFNTTSPGRIFLVRDLAQNMDTPIPTLDIYDTPNDDTDSEQEEIDDVFEQLFVDQDEAVNLLEALLLRSKKSPVTWIVEIADEGSALGVKGQDQRWEATGKRSGNFPENSAPTSSVGEGNRNRFVM